MTTNTKTELNRLIDEALTPLTVNGVLPENAVLSVLDPTTCIWLEYAIGGTPAWFANVIDEDAIVEIYRGARIISHYSSVLVDYRW